VQEIISGLELDKAQQQEVERRLTQLGHSGKRKALSSKTQVAQSESAAEKKWLKPSDCSGTAIAFVISIGMGDSLVMLVVAAWWSSTNQSPQQSSMVQRQHNFLQNQS
jgi:hypothetical protein